MARGRTQDKLAAARTSGGPYGASGPFCPKHEMLVEGIDKKGTADWTQLRRNDPLRLSPALKDKVETWAAKQPDAPSRSEALRRLVEMGLAANGKPRRPLNWPKVSGFTGIQLSETAQGQSREMLMSRLAN
jgi:hypothetical protein